MVIALNTLSSSAGLGIASFQIATIITSFSSQTNFRTATPYGKFSRNTEGVMISGRNNMLLIYTPALILNTASLINPATFAGSQLLALCLTIHFLKRVLETLFLHKYSTKVNCSVGAFIGVYYTLVSWIILHFNKLAEVGLRGGPKESILGVLLFAFGEVGNFYHHYLLARLRREKGDVDQKYMVPEGGLFSRVTCPHYLFELLAWLGISLISQEIHSYLAFASMASYLGGRSVSQTKWAQKNIEGYPKERKNIVPILF